MSILDNLFSVAADMVTRPGTTIEIWISITISPSSPFPNTDRPGNISLGWAQLTYTPAKVVPLQHGFLQQPAYFEGGVSLAVDQYDPNSLLPSATQENIGLIITGPTVLHFGPVNYSVGITFPATGRVSFAPEVDPTTNVIYGAEGSNFIVISLSAPMLVQQAQ